MEEKKEKKEKKDFVLEQGMEQLERILCSLEKENHTLEESFALYQNGMTLLKQCNDSIDKIEKQILVLNGGGEANEFE